MYGMNFFGFNNTSRRIIMGHGFWIFAATWLPLTLLTAAIYVTFLRFDAAKKGKQVSWPWTRARPGDVGSKEVNSEKVER